MESAPTVDPYATWDAAYVLGALLPEERQEFDTRLRGCGDRRTRVGEIEPIRRRREICRSTYLYMEQSCGYIT
jgi:hypothetical protein